MRDAEHPPVPAHRRASIVRDFKRAWQAQDISALVELLDPQATAVADGGGRVPASLVPIQGGRDVAAYLAGLAARAPHLGLVERSVNGQPGLIATDEGTIAAVYAFEIADDRIRRIWVVRNPDKLGARAAATLGG